jgi:glycosidase
MKLLSTLTLLFTTQLLFAQSVPYKYNPTNAVIYEVNVRQYSSEGTFSEVTKNIPTLKNLGVDILWLMPVHPIGIKNRKGTLGSYYSVKDYRGIDESYGSAMEFRELVAEAHSHGMKVIIDWVANHTAWDHEWIAKHPNWYVQDSLGKIVTQYDWTDVAKLNYQNKDMRKAMIADMKYWLKEYDIDGFRCDVAFLVPQDFWDQARKELDGVKPVYMLAEMEWNADLTQTPNTYFDKAFNTSYGWNFMGVTQDMAKGKKTLNDFRKEMNENYAKFPAQMSKMFFITNHDENTWNGTIAEKYGNNWKLYATLCYTLPQSMPLMYTGEEAGLNRRLLFFEKDNITKQEWSDTSRYEWYRALINLRHINPALANNGSAKINEINISQGDTAISNNVYAFKRKQNGNEVIVVTNFSNHDIELFVTNLPLDLSYKKLFDTNQFYKNDGGNWIIKANQNVILYK